MNNFFALFITLGVVPAVSYFTFIKGWGLEPQSWFIIIGGLVFATMLNWLAMLLVSKQ